MTYSAIRIEFFIFWQAPLADWKRVILSDETNINCLGSDWKKWVWNNAGEGLSDRLVEGMVKFSEGSMMV